MSYTIQYWRWQYRVKANLARRCPSLFGTSLRSLVSFCSNSPDRHLRRYLLCFLFRVVFVWGFGVLFLSCVWVSVAGVLFLSCLWVSVSGVLFLSCVWVSVSGVLFSVGVCGCRYRGCCSVGVCGCDLLISLSGRHTHRLDALRHRGLQPRTTLGAAGPP